MGMELKEEPDKANSLYNGRLEEKFVPATRHGVEVCLQE